MNVLFAIITLLASEVAPIADAEVWNEGVGYYEAGDVTNALRVLRPLMVSKTHAARAAEVVAKLEHERGNREEAAAAAQVALRASPKNEKANRNFTRATDGLLAAREQRRIEALIKAAEGKDPAALIKASTEEARKLMTDAGTYRTNAAPQAVSLADQYEQRARRLTDAWVPLRATIAQSVTNEEQAATILAQLDQAEAKTKAAAKQLGDLDGEAYGSLSGVEHDFTRFLKMVAMPPMAMDEDHIAQTNAWLGVDSFNGRDWQHEALDYTRVFRTKFPAWARAYEQQAQADTNKPPFTAEAQAKISALANELEKLQIACCEKTSRDDQLRALKIIDEIRELLPKDGGGQGQSNQQQNQQQNQQDQQQSQQQDQQQQQQQEESDERQEENPEQQEAEQQPEQKPEEGKEDQELEALLRKAQERNDEHEADKRERMRKAPLPPNERDW